MGFPIFVTVLAFGNDYVERPAAPVDLRSMLAIFIPSIAEPSDIFHGFSVWIYTADGWNTFVRVIAVIFLDALDFHFI
jgi:hypothetical protein